MTLPFPLPDFDAKRVNTAFACDPYGIAPAVRNVFEMMIRTTSRMGLSPQRSKSTVAEEGTIDSISWMSIHVSKVGGMCEAKTSPNT